MKFIKMFPENLIAFYKVVLLPSGNKEVYL